MFEILKPKWDRITEADATDGWCLQGPEIERWLRKTFPGGNAVIRVINANGLLRLAYGNETGLLTAAGTTIQDLDMARVKAIADTWISDRLHGQPQRGRPATARQCHKSMNR
ncbi:hypothetical protein ACIBG0_35015 [Nocardia sp. NPDC050630]|uniref:hypothetical protein n=1 Tax=Nocardia sp. NPDC050630 TaxID=3364321 RepID=UPI0037965DAE